MNDKKFNRRILREHCLQALYAYELNPVGINGLVEQFLAEAPSKADKAFGEKLIREVILHSDGLDRMIKERVENWEMERIALIDRLLLRMAIAELLYFPDIPPKVSINEAIEISKEYSTVKSGKFINGILDAILNQLKNSGKLNKTGRGLIEESLSKKPPEK